MVSAGRSCQDALQATFATSKGRTRLGGGAGRGLKAAFDRIDHHHLLGQLGGFPARDRSGLADGG